MSFFVTYDAEAGTYTPTMAGYTTLVLIMIAVLLVASYILKADKKLKAGTRALVFSGMAIALAYVTSMIKIWHMPMGGSITLLSMLFIVLIGHWYGLGFGLLAALSYGLLQLITDPYIISVPQMLVDYIFAFGALGLSGLFSNQKNGLRLGYLVAVLGRWFFSILSGVIFFGMYAPESFELFGLTIPLNPVTYSVLYNGGYLVPEALLTLIVISIPPVAAALNRVTTLART